MRYLSFIIAWILCRSELAIGERSSSSQAARRHRLSPLRVPNANTAVTNGSKNDELTRHFKSVNDPIIQRITRMPRGGGGDGSSSLVSKAAPVAKTLLLSKKGPSMVIIGYGALQGLLGASDPSWFWKDTGDLENVTRGSVAFWAAELNGLLTLTISIISVLAMITDLSIFQVAGWSSFPVLLFLLEGMGDSGSLSKLGFTSVFGPSVLLYIVAILAAAFVPRAQALQTMYLFTPLTIAGLYGWLFPAAAADDVGIEFKTGADKTLWVFLSCTLLSLSSLIQTLLQTGGDAVTAIRNMIVMTAITTLDVKFVRPTTLTDAKFLPAKSTQFTMFVLVLTLLMLLLPREI